MLDSYRSQQSAKLGIRGKKVLSRRVMSTPVPVPHQENFDENSKEKVNEKIDPIIRNSQKVNIA